MKVQFLLPDPARYRISADGRYVIEKMTFGDPPETRYVLWKYEATQGGFATFDEAREAAWDWETDRMLKTRSEPDKD